MENTIKTENVMKELFMAKKLWQVSLMCCAVALTAGTECVSEIFKKQAWEGST